MTEKERERFKFTLTEMNLRDFENNPDIVQKYEEIDSFVNAEIANRRLIIENLIKARGMMGKR